MATAVTTSPSSAHATAYKVPSASRPSRSRARQQQQQQQQPQEDDDEHMSAQLARIAASGRTPFEKRVWSALCRIPRGRFTTYGLLSAHLGTSPRAVGNALRRNPFAPDVPCHRVVATGGRLGGFKGSWPRDGEGITLVEKRGLLKGEGVRFDEEGGKVLGSPWMFK